MSHSVSSLDPCSLVAMIVRMVVGGGGDRSANGGGWQPPLMGVQFPRVVIGGGDGRMPVQALFHVR